MNMKKIKSLLKGKESRILHVGCGNGSVSEAISKHLCSPCFGIEKDRKLANKAAKKLVKVLKGCSITDTEITPGSFGMVLAQLDGFLGKEDESFFIRRVTDVLAPLGVLLLDIPEDSMKKLTDHGNALSYRYRDMTLLHREKDGLTFIGLKKPDFMRNVYMERFLSAYSSGKASLLPMEYEYDLLPIRANLKTFHSTLITMEDMEEELQQSNLYQEIASKYFTPPAKKVLKCLIPPSIGHLAKLAANGDMDGLAEHNGERILCKGFTVKSEIYRDEIDPDTGKKTKIMNQKISTFMHAFNLENGDCYKVQLA